MQPPSLSAPRMPRYCRPDSTLHRSMSALSLSVEYSMETYGGTVLSGAARWRLGGIERRKVMGGGFGRLAACAAASHWALRLSKAFRVRGATRSLRSLRRGGGLARSGTGKAALSQPCCGA